MAIKISTLHTKIFKIGILGNFVFVSRNSIFYFGISIVKKDFWEKPSNDMSI